MDIDQSARSEVPGQEPSLTLTNLSNYSDELERIGVALAPGATVLIPACMFGDRTGERPRRN
jgi:hypothetical protein